MEYVDDMTIAESINLKGKLLYLPESVRPLPDSFHAKTGHVLLLQNSKVYTQLLKTEEYSERNAIFQLTPSSQ